MFVEKQMMGHVIQKDIFTPLDALYTAVSLILYLAALSTDVIVGIHLLNVGEVTWAIVILVIVAIATVVMAIVSLAWYSKETSEDSRAMKCFTHVLLMAPVYRYVNTMSRGIDAQRTPTKHKCEVYFESLRDTCHIRLIDAFLQAAPQLGVQLYIMISMDIYTDLMWLSVSSSAMSIGWAMAAQIMARHLRYNELHEIRWAPALVLFLWHMALVTGRVLAIVVFTHAFAYWTILAIGIHLFGVFIWKCVENSHSSHHPCTARILDLITSYVHIFCFYKTREGHTRLHVFIFYLMILIENALFVGLWHGLKPDGSNPSVIIMSLVFGGFLLGVFLMFLYYGCCHKGGRFTIDSVSGPFFDKGNCFTQGNTYERNASPCDLSDENFSKGLNNKTAQKRDKHMKKNEKIRESPSSTGSDQYLIRGRQNRDGIDDRRGYKYREDHNNRRRPDTLYTITTSVSKYNDGQYSPSQSSGKLSISPLDASKLWEASSERCMDTDDKRYYDMKDENTENRRDWDSRARLDNGDSVSFVNGPRGNAKSISPVIDQRVGRGRGRYFEGNVDDDNFVDRMEYKKRPSSRYSDGNDHDDNFVDRMEYRKRPSNMDDVSVLYNKLNTSRYSQNDADNDFDGRVGIHDSMLSKRASNAFNDSITTPMRQNRGGLYPAEESMDPGNSMYRKILKGMANPRDSIEDYSASPYKSSDRLDEFTNTTLASLARGYGHHHGVSARTTSKEQLAEVTKRFSSSDSDYSDEIANYMEPEETERNAKNTNKKRVGMDADIMTDIKNSPHLGHVDQIQHDFVPGNDILSSLVTKGDRNRQPDGVQRSASTSQPGNDVMKSLMANDQLPVKVHSLAENRLRKVDQNIKKPPVAPKYKSKRDGRRDKENRDIDPVDRSDSLRHADQVQKEFIPGNSILQGFVTAEGTPNSGVQSSNKHAPQKRGNSLLQDLVSTSEPGVHETDIDDFVGDRSQENSDPRQNRVGKAYRQPPRGRRPLASMNSVRL